MTEDKKWELVKEFYEKNYRGIRFTVRPSPIKVDFLYQEMVKFKESMAAYKARARPSLVRIIGNN